MQIAVVGIGCWLPGAAEPADFFANLLAGRCEFRRFPKCRLGEEYQDFTTNNVDKTYATRAAFMDGFEFEWRKRRIPKKTVDMTDPVQWLALEVALQAVADAGSPLPAETTAVIVGNTLTGEVSRTNGFRLRWPYVKKAVEQVLSDLGSMDPAEVQHVLDATEEVFKGNLPPPTEDLLAGTLSNTIAGRIANFLNLRGGCLCVDGACASGLLAVDAACAKLVSGAADAVICGGVDMSLDIYEMAGFARVGALTRSEMRVYGEDASGFIAGEGCGMLVLKRLDDAVKADDHVYAVIEGVATSADGKGAMTAPTVAGQSLALDRAYRTASYGMGELDFVEGHGTGTKAGDPVELRAVAAVLRRHLEAAGVPPEQAKRRVGMTSIKSLLGHTKAASGAIGLIKAVCAVNQRVVPPTFNIIKPNPVFSAGEDCDVLYPVLEGEVKPAGTPMRAGVSSMGFGGINVHLTISSYGDQPSPKLATPLPLHAMLASSQRTEVFAVSADKYAGLKAQVSDLRQYAGDLSYAELADLAADLAGRCQPGQPLRLAIIAGTPADLEAALDDVLRRLTGPGSVASGTRIHGATPKYRFWLSHVAGPARVGYLFPGQGSQLLNAARVLVHRHAWAKELVSSADKWLSDAGCKPISGALFVSLDRRSAAEAEALQEALGDTQRAQPALVLCSLLWSRFLGRLGVAPAVVAGHSLGELSALAAAGALSDEQLVVVAGLRGKLMSASRGGAMAALTCGEAGALDLIATAGAEGGVWVANKNAPAQTVVSGEPAKVDAVVAEAKRQGVRATRLRVGGAFHCPLQAQAAESFRKQLAVENPKLPSTSSRPAVVSTLTGRVLPPGTDLAQHLSSQLRGAVDFVAAADTLRCMADILLEVGPKQVMSGLMAANASGGSCPPCLPLEAAANQDLDVNCALAQLHTAGVDLCWSEAFAGRYTKPLVRPSQRKFIVNPVEKPLPPTPAAAIQAALVVAAQRASLPASTPPWTHRLGPAAPLTPAASIGELTPAPLPLPAAVAAATAAAQVQARITELVCEATGFEASDVTPDLLLLDDLNLDSIKIGEMMAQLGGELGVEEDAIDPAAVPTSTIAELAAALAGAVGDGAATIAFAAAPPASASRAPTAPPTALPTGAAAATAAAQVQARITELVCEATGFDASDITPDLLLLDDLNLDSIKIGELMVQLAGELGVEEDSIDPAAIPTSTIAELAAALAGAATQPMAQSDPSALQPVRPPPASAPTLAEPAPRPTKAPVSTTRLPDGYLSSRPTWVRDFTMKPRLAALPARTLAVEQLLPVAVVYAPQQRGAAEAIAAALEGQLGGGAGAVRLVALADSGVYEGVPGALAGCAAAMVAMPGFASSLPSEAGRSAATANLSAAVLASSLALLKRVVGGGGGATPTTLLYAQSGAGHPSPEPRPAANLTSALAFASSVHLERPHMRVRVVDLPVGMVPPAMASCLIDEMAHGGSWSAAGYTGGRGGAALVRYSPRVTLNDPRTYVPAAQLGPGDVILVTGGGGGITAECAKALAVASGAQLALVGRSPVEKVAGTLEAMAAGGVRCTYYSADVADQGAVQALVARVQQEQGTITGVVHGAAVQTLGRADAVTLSDVVRQVAPKISGLLNLVACLDLAQLKVLAAFSSIIGSTGMQGSAWYGFSNECVDAVCRSIKAQCPACAVSSQGYSVWGEVGMGARLGSVDALAKMGISAIPVKDGVEHFLRLTLMGTGSTSTLVTARVDQLDTMLLPEPDVPPRQLHFAHTVVANTLGVECVALLQVTNVDPFVRDHVYKGSFLMPTTIGIEAMAEVVAVLTGRTATGLGEWVEVQDLELERPVTAPTSGAPATLLVWAEVVEEQAGEAAQGARPGPLPTRVRVGLRCEATRFSRDHFWATFVLDGGLNQAEVAAMHSAADTDINGRSVLATLTAGPVPRLPIDPETQLYGNSLLFQGPLYHRIADIACIEDAAGQRTSYPDVAASLHVLRSADSVAGRDGIHRQGSPAKELPLLLGDPFMHDALLQACQFIEPGLVSLPVRVGKWVFRCPRTDAPHQTGRCPAVVFRTERTDIARNDCLAWDPSGSLLSYFRGASFCDLGRRSPMVYTHNLVAGDVAPAYNNVNGPTGPGAPTPLDNKRLDEMALPSPEVEAAAQQLGAGLEAAGVRVAGYRVPSLAQLTATQRRLHVELPLVQRLLEQQAGGAGMALVWDGPKPRLARQPRSLCVGIGQAGAAAAGAPGSAASISHTGSMLVLATGGTATGIDVEEVVPSRQDESHWRRMLGGWGGELQQVQASGAGGDDVATAGTRLWAAKEALIKAAGTPSAKVTQVKGPIEGALCLALSTAEGAEYSVVTTTLQAAGPRPITLVLAVCTAGSAAFAAASEQLAAAQHAAATRLPAATKSLATAVPAAASAAVPSSGQLAGRPVHAAPGAVVMAPTKAKRTKNFLNTLRARMYLAGFLPRHFRLNLSARCVTFDYPILFNDVGADQTLIFLSYAKMMSMARELLLPPAAHAQVAAAMADNGYLVTKRCEIRELEVPRFSNGQLQVRVTNNKHAGGAFNEMSLRLEVVTASKPRRVVAVLRLLAAFVTMSPLPGGGYKAERRQLVPALQEFYDRTGASQWAWPEGLLDVEASAGLLGARLWHSSSRVVRGWPLLHTETFVTDMLEGNLAQNTYWANYVAFACRVVDRWTTALFKGQGSQRGVADGYFRIVQTTSNFMTDSVPRDAVEVQVRVSSVHERGLQLAITCSRTVGSAHIKMNETMCTAVWTDTGETCTIPAKVSAAILAATGESHGGS